MGCNVCEVSLMETKILSFWRQTSILVTNSMEFPFPEVCLEENERVGISVKMNCYDLLSVEKNVVVKYLLVLTHFW